MTERRGFITKASGVMAAMAATAMVDAPYVIVEPKVQWRLSTTWPKQLDNLQGAAQRLAQVVEEMSGGRFRIEVFPGGQIMQPLDCFGATSKGTIEAFMGASSYWSATEPATDWFISIPFGIDPQGMTVWYYHGDGLKLWEETRPRRLSRQERDGHREAEDGIQGEGRARPVSGAGPAGSQEARHRGHPRTIGEESHGEEGARVAHEVPASARRLGLFRARDLPVRQRVTRPLRAPRAAGATLPPRRR